MSLGQFFPFGLSVAIIIAMVAGCHSRGRAGRVHFVVPMGFRGAIAIVPNAPDGAPLEIQDGVRYYRIPASGLLRVQDQGPFFDWGKMSAMYADGSHLKTAHDLAPDSATALCVFCTDGDGTIWMYLGPRSEMVGLIGSAWEPGKRVGARSDGTP
ncbi:MAG: hypothetical protein ACOY3P_22270 [Planctomycetota bacterium]